MLDAGLKLPTNALQLGGFNNNIKREFESEMENSFTQFTESVNPWRAQDKATTALQKAIILGERTGHVAKKLDYKDESPEDDRYLNLPSIKLIKILKSMSQTKEELNKINLEIQCRMQDKETSDVTHLDVLEKRISKIKSLNGYIESIIDSKTQLIQRLQQPFKGDFLKLEAQYHRFASEIFPQISPLLSDLTTNLENIIWAKSLSAPDLKMDAMIAELYSVLDAMQTSFQSYCQIHQSMGQLHHLQTGQLHSTKLEEPL